MADGAKPRKRGKRKRNDSEAREEATRGYMQKTQMCKFWEEGKCARGDNCTFAHGGDELKSAPDFTKTRICVAFQQGKCTDDQCSFAHGKEEIRKLDPSVTLPGPLPSKKPSGRGKRRRNPRRGGGSSDGSDRSLSPYGNGEGSPVCERCLSTVALHLGTEVCPRCRFPTRLIYDYMP
mmetsp:Transcript_71057/g.126499  ORF Transcript_71057/g.126499 Transcript_71057/m.126499 type:complete len:178 (-) Transcript_71057:144-677(-)